MSFCGSKLDSPPTSLAFVVEDVAPPSFLLQNDAGRIEAFGMRRAVPDGDLASLTDRTCAFFSNFDRNPAGRHLIVGALPFDPAEADFLFQPESVLQSPVAEISSRAILPNADLLSIKAVKLRPEPSADQFCEAVRLAVRKLELQTPADLEKVVLARCLRVEADQSVDPFLLSNRLSIDSQVTTFVAPLADGARDHRRWMVGATPELLVSRHGTQVVSHPLAGSVARHADHMLDRQAANGLLSSKKDLHEHRLVVEAICDALAPYCRDLRVPPAPQLRSTRAMWHLATHIEGQLRNPETPVTTLVAALHPTPAVCGTPRSAALQTIRELESFTRGYYGGAVGWVDDAGDGEWYVTIRCALLEDRTLQLFAGAGIVEGSIPEMERQETSAKFRTLLHALGISEDA